MPALADKSVALLYLQTGSRQRCSNIPPRDIGLVPAKIPVRSLDFLQGPMVEKLAKKQLLESLLENSNP
jgi:hypothetical protein